MRGGCAGRWRAQPDPSLLHHHARSAPQFNNWPGNLDVYAEWLPLLDAAVDAAAPTDAQLAALYAGNAVKAYRLEL